MEKLYGNYRLVKIYFLPYEFSPIFALIVLSCTYIVVRLLFVCVSVFFLYVWKLCATLIQWLSVFFSKSWLGLFQRSSQIYKISSTELL